MLNPFPIQYLSLLAYFILRFGIGLVLIHLGIKHITYRYQLHEAFEKTFGRMGVVAITGLIVGELVIGTLLILGAYTQYAALVLALMSLDMMLSRRWFAHPVVPPRILYVVLFFASLSLCITGAGAFAVDLPL